MKIRTYAFLLLLTTLFQSAQAQTSVAKVENHLNGDLDYTHEALDLIQTQANGQEITLGKINTDGTVQFNLPEFDIKALYDSIPMKLSSFHQLFLMDSSCKDRDVFAETPFDDIYAQEYDPIFIKKYGINVAVLESVSDEKMLRNNQYVSDSLAVGSRYFWFYIDRAIAFKDECTKTSFNGNYDIEVAVSADIQFEKGWNFIEENLAEIQKFSREDYHTTLPKKIQFAQSSPASKKVKWFLRQIQENEKIQAAKRLYNLTAITKEQFEKWTPKKLGDLSVTTKEHGNPPEGQKNKNNIHLIYSNETQKKEIHLYVIDCANSPDDMEMVNFAYAMENDGKDEKDIKPYVSQYNERIKATKLLYKVEDRIIIDATGKNIEGEELWGYIQKLHIEKLLKK